MNDQRTNATGAATGGLWPVLMSGAGNAMLLLAIWWSCRGGRPEPAASPAVFQPLSMLSTEADDGAAAMGASRGGFFRAAVGQQGKSIWSRLVAEDPRVFAANLREVGCPTETICDLVRPLIERNLARGLAAAGYETHFWATGAERAAVRMARERERIRLKDESAARLSELGCSSGDLDEGEGNLKAQQEVEFLAGILPREKRQGLIGIALEAAQTVERWRERTGGMLLPEDRQAIEAESAKLWRRVQATLSDAEFAELSLRVQAVTLSGTDGEEVLAQLKVTPEEYRKLVPVLAHDESNRFSDLFTLRELLGRRGEQEGLSPDAIRAEVTRILGQERGEEYLARTDPPYPITTEWTAKLGLPADTSRLVHRALAGFEQSLAGVRQRWTTDPERGRTMFRESEARARARLLQILAEVPAGEREARLTEWLRLAARRGWGPP